MILDITLGILFLASVVWGYRKGFTEAFLHTIGWVLAVFLGFIWTPAAASFLRSRTGLEERLGATLAERMGNPSVGADALQGVPNILRDAVSDAASIVQSKAIENFVHIVTTLAALLCIILIIKLIFWIVTLLFSKKKRGGIVALSDSLLGLVFGAVKGGLVICILLAFFLPIANVFQSEVLLSQLYESTYAIRIYDSNPIFFLTQIFF